MKELFMRIVKLPKDKESLLGYWDAFQIEVLETREGRIVRRFLFDKPDTKQMVLSKAELMLDPESGWDDGEIGMLPEASDEKATKRTKSSKR